MQRGEQERIWAEALGAEKADQLWDALEPDVPTPALNLPPEPEAGPKPRPRWPLVAAVAATLVFAVLLAQLSVQVGALRAELAELRLERLESVASVEASPVTSLATLDATQSMPWTKEVGELLEAVVATHEDPNVQLRAIDLLAGRGGYPTERMLAVAETARHNAALLRAYVQGIRRL